MVSATFRAVNVKLFEEPASKPIPASNVGDKLAGVPLEPLRFGVPLMRTVAPRTEANTQRADADSKALSKGNRFLLAQR